MKRLFLILWFAVIFALGHPINADQRQADIKVAEGWENAISKLKSDPRKQEKESKDWWDKMRKKGGKDFEPFIRSDQESLGRFGYAVGPFTGILNEQTRRAIREYQRYNHLPETGDLDWDTDNKINSDRAILDNEPCLLPSSFFYADQWNQYVYASGTWVMTNDTIAWPQNRAEVECRRQDGLCIVGTAYIATPMLWHLLNTFEVDHWDDYEIISKPDDSGLCGRTVLKINRANKSVEELSSPKINAGVCKTVNGKEDTLTVLKDGMKVREELFEKYTKEKNRILRTSHQ